MEEKLHKEALLREELEARERQEADKLGNKSLGQLLATVQEQESKIKELGQENDDLRAKIK